MISIGTRCIRRRGSHTDNRPHSSPVHWSVSPILSLGLGVFERVLAQQVLHCIPYETLNP